MLLSSALSFTLLVPSAHAQDPALALHSLRDCALPPHLEARWERGQLTDAELVRQVLALRAALPGTYQRSTLPPPSPVLVPDFAPMRTLLLSYPGWADHDPAFLAVVAAATGHGRVRLSPMRSQDAVSLLLLLRSEGIDLDAVDISDSPAVDTVWMRDFGPVPVSTDEGPGLLDFWYSADCLANDAFPTELVRGEGVWRPPIYLDGGNLLGDGEGTCFTTDTLPGDNGVDLPTMSALLEQWAGCEQVVYLEPLAGDVVDHVDMLLSVAPDGVLLLAAFDPAEDPANHAVMARNRAQLEALAQPWVLVDLPSPPPAPDATGQPMVRTWTNLLPFNGVVLVPEYSSTPAVRRELAWTRIAEAFPDRELVAVPSDVLIEQRGAVHCIGRALP